MRLAYGKLIMLLSMCLIGLCNVAVADNNPNVSKSNDFVLDAAPVFDESTIMGTVYADHNQNGIQDVGDEGIAGVRLVTATGLIITTDQYGRYSLEGISGGNSERGINFIIKLDKDSLPPQYQLISNQTVVVRLTPGLPQRIDFRVIQNKQGQ